MQFKQLFLLILSLAAAAVVHAAADEYMPPNTPSIPSGSIERSEAKLANSLLNRAVDYLQTNSPEDSFKAFNDHSGKFVSNEYYVYVIGLDGVMYASGGASSSFVGLNVLDLRDASGNEFIRQMLDIAEHNDAGVIVYHWLNSVDNRLEIKTTQFHKVGNYLVCVGYYVPRASMEEAQALLDRAVSLLKKSGGKTAFKNFNDPKSGFVIKDEYVFAIGLDDGKYRASGAAPFLTGKDVRELTDAVGKPLFKEMIALAKEKGGGTIDYVWRNPATNAIENKHTLIQRVGSVLLGVGYYTKN